MKKTKKEIRAIVYLSVEGDMRKIPYKEEKQLRYIREYAKAHTIKIVKIVHRDVRGISLMNSQFKEIVNDIALGQADVILVSKTGCIAQSVPEAYQKAAMVAQAGGKLVTVKEGVLYMPVKIAVLGGKYKWID